MKNYFFLLLVVVTTLSYSQVDRRIGWVPSDSQKPKKKEKLDPVKVSVEFLKKDLKLDGFQEAAVKSLFEEYMNTNNTIIASDITAVEKEEKIAAGKQRLDEKIREILNPEQVQLFEAILERVEKKQKK